MVENILKKDGLSLDKMKEHDNSIGCRLRKEYENGRIRTENEFKEVLNRVLFNCKET